MRKVEGRLYENFAIDDKGLEGFVTLSDIAYYLFVEVEEFLAMKGSSADRGATCVMPNPRISYMLSGIYHEKVAICSQLSSSITQ
ncbi:hypothetical protein Pyn_14155 [Prunus yedoensis var. nudiflora]|uniref:Uncharacterized protein n=1 Tax=Prunus yedoensis var. nudiflora TaxID=2094558 RepID=A0A314XHT6_PRUYE|nr:hypothetical protein Pyn_14155 [Prunus yedoensis var. nudiflora]